MDIAKHQTSGSSKHGADQLRSNKELCRAAQAIAAPPPGTRVEPGVRKAPTAAASSNAAANLFAVASRTQGFSAQVKGGLDDVLVRLIGDHGSSSNGGQLAVLKDLIAMVKGKSVDRGLGIDVLDNLALRKDLRDGALAGLKELGVANGWSVAGSRPEHFKPLDPFAEPQAVVANNSKAESQSQEIRSQPRTGILHGFIPGESPAAVAAEQFALLSGVGTADIVNSDFAKLASGVNAHIAGAGGNVPARTSSSDESPNQALASALCGLAEHGEFLKSPAFSAVSELANGGQSPDAFRLQTLLAAPGQISTRPLMALEQAIKYSKQNNLDATVKVMRELHVNLKSFGHSLACAHEQLKSLEQIPVHSRARLWLSGEKGRSLHDPAVKAQAIALRAQIVH